MRLIMSAAVLGAVLVGCAQPQLAPLNFSVPNIGLSARPLDAEIRSLTVTLGRPDEQVGLIDWEFIDVTGGGAITAAWQIAMQEALDRTLIFRDGGSKKVSVAVKILKLEISRGFALTERSVETVARYEVIDRTNGDIVYTQEIAASGVVPIDFASELMMMDADYAGQLGIREGVNRAVQNNISLFLQAAETIDLTRPMFPAGTT